MLRLGVGLERLLEFHDLLAVHLVHVAVVDGEDRERLLGDRHRRVLLLLHELGDALAALELLAGRFVEVRGELREGRELAVLREREADAAAQLLDDAGLRRAADSGHRDTRVHRGPDAGVEEVGLEEDLAVGDRDDVRRHEGRHVARLGLDDRQARERSRLALDLAAADLLDVFGRDARRALEQARVQVEHVARIRLAARRAAKQQRDLAVGPGLLGEVVIDDDGVLAVVHEVLAHRAARVGRDVLHGGRRRGGSRHDDRVRHRAVLFELAHHVRDRALLLADRDVDALNARALLVDDRVDRERGLAGLAVADDQLALAAADRHHRVDRLVAGLHRLADALAPDDARRNALDRGALARLDRALAVERIAERVHHAAEHLGTDRHFEDAAGGLHRRALADVAVLAEHHGADRVLLQVQREAEGVVRELEHFAVGGVGESVHAADAVRHGDDGADVSRLGRSVEVLDPCLDQVGDFRCLDGHIRFP